MQDEKTIDLTRVVNEHYNHFTGVAERLVDSIPKEKEEQNRNMTQAFQSLVRARPPGRLPPQPLLERASILTSPGSYCRRKSAGGSRAVSRSRTGRILG